MTRPKERTHFRDITQAIYAAISGPPGPRNYDGIRQLYAEGARLIRTGIDAEGRVFAISMTVDQHERDVSTLLADMAFEEVEIAHGAEIFGNVARVRSVYRSVYGSGPKARHGRGINYMNLVFDGRDWKVASVVWDNEREGLSVSSTTSLNDDAVRIICGDEVVVRMADEPDSLMALRKFLMIAKYNDDRREITLGNALLNNIIAGIDRFMISKKRQGSRWEKIFADALANSAEIGDELLTEIVSVASRWKNEIGVSNLDDAKEYVRLAAFPSKISSERLDRAARQVLQ